MRRNKFKLGLGVLTVLATPIAVNAVASNDAQAAQGWVKSGNAWYLYNQNGTLVRNTWAGNYWLGADGRMATNTWVDGGRYYVGSNGAWVKGAQNQAATNTIKQGWTRVGNSWYFYNHGKVVANAWIGNYWLGADGKMAINAWVDGGRYYVGTDGSWVKGAQNTTTVKNGWVKEGSAWYYYKNGSVVRNAWAGNYWLGADGRMAINAWVDGGRYYVGTDGSWVKGAQNTTTVKNGWVKEGYTWYYYKNGSVVRNAWAGNYWLGADGRMATNAWVDGGRYYVGTDGAWVKGAQNTTSVKGDWVKEGNAWYYYKNGSVVRNAWVGNYWLGADGRMATNSWVDNNRYYVGNNGAWVKGADRTASKSENNTNSTTYSGYYKVTSLYIPVYDANGRILSHVSKDTILFRDNRATANGRIPVQVAGITGYVNSGQVAAVNSSTTFIPDYVSDGKYVYHRYSAYNKVMVAYHNPNMQVGKSYYSADGINFGSFKLDHPFQFSNLKSRSNYTAADINRLYSLMGANNSKLAGKGATFKAAEQRYGVNALYLVAHSALESAWGRSQIARDKNNFFGIAAYDTTPYTSATKFDDVDSGILGAARWIDRNYLSNTGYPANGAYLGNKARGMNVNYATAPYWGESIASIMFSANEKLGRKDR